MSIIYKQKNGISCNKENYYPLDSLQLSNQIGATNPINHTTASIPRNNRCYTNITKTYTFEKKKQTNANHFNYLDPSEKHPVWVF